MTPVFPLAWHPSLCGKRQISIMDREPTTLTRGLTASYLLSIPPALPQIKFFEGRVIKKIKIKPGQTFQKARSERASHGFVLCCCFSLCPGRSAFRVLAPTPAAAWAP